MAVSATALGAAGIGAVFVYAGVKGYSVPHALQAVISGTSPAASPVLADQVAPLSGAYGTPAAGSGSTSGGTGAPGGSTAGSQVANSGSAQAILQQTAAQFGWTGAEWQALSNVEMAEAGFNPNAKNPASGAYGLAQSLGHPEFGYPEYGGYGLSKAQVAAANNGDAAAQSLWMCRYIASTYGDPIAAWRHEQAHHWY